MKTDIQIAQEAQMAHIKDVAATVGIEEEELEFYGKYKAKLSDDVWEKVKDKPNGKLVLVTAINPTPAGEGTVSYTHLDVYKRQGYGRVYNSAAYLFPGPGVRKNR